MIAQIDLTLKWGKTMLSSKVVFRVKNTIAFGFVVYKERFKWIWFYFVGVGGSWVTFYFSCLWFTLVIKILAKIFCSVLPASFLTLPCMPKSLPQLGEPRAEESPVVDTQKVKGTGLDVQLVCKRRSVWVIALLSLSSSSWFFFSPVIDHHVVPLLGHARSQVCTIALCETAHKLQASSRCSEDSRTAEDVHAAANAIYVQS